MHEIRDGTKIALHDLKDSHLQNIINLLQRKAEEGILVCSGGGFDASEIWYDEYKAFGDEALRLLHYDKYLAEQERRKQLVRVNEVERYRLTHPDPDNDDPIANRFVDEGDK